MHAAEQLDPTELREFTSHVLNLQAKRSAPSVSHEEGQLLLKINERLPAETQLRYDQLIAMRDAESLTPDEQRELEQLTKQAEAFDVDRVEALSKLAAIRGISLADLMDDLKIRD
jgi:hypothetical protein